VDAWLLRGTWANSSFVALVVAAVLAIAFAAAPADARTKSKKQYRDEPPSLDGRTTGQLRTCGYDTLQYGSGGTPHGPYCH
jgi:hypothetical protein